MFWFFTKIEIFPETIACQLSKKKIWPFNRDIKMCEFYISIYVCIYEVFAMQNKKYIFSLNIGENNKLY